MIVFGGYRVEVGCLNELWLLDLRWMTWNIPEYFGVPPSPRRSHSAIVIDKYMYIFGGFDGMNHLNDLHVFDMQSKGWVIHRTIGTPPSPRRQHAMVLVKKHIVIYGGFNGSDFLDDVHSLDTRTSIWCKWIISEPENSPIQLADHPCEVLGRSMHTIALSGQGLVIFGGVCAHAALNNLMYMEKQVITTKLTILKLLKINIAGF